MTMMRPIPLNFLTLYADLAQSVRPNNFGRGTIKVRNKRGKDYLFAVSRDGARRVEKYIGPADDPEAQEKAAGIREGSEQGRAARSTVAALKQARIPAPSLKLGKVLEVLANEGLFERGIVLIGTGAFQTYACVLGYYLRSGFLATNDADILVASFVGTEKPKDLETILQRADPTFKAKMRNEDRLPMVFKSKDDFTVDVLTKFGRGRTSPILIEELGCSAEALPFMEYLATESIETVALYNAGVMVRVPPPGRYAVHKLLIAQERRGRFLAKKPKDLAQARDIIDILLETDSDSLEEALEDAKARGPSWRKNINASLRELKRETRQGMLPIEVRRKAEKN